MTTLSALALLPLLAGMPEVRDLSCGDLPVILRMMAAGHYAGPSITSVAEDRSVDQFIESLDPSKTLLLQSDVKRLKNELPAIFAGLRRDDCTVLDRAGNLVVRRARADLTYVKDLVSKKGFKLDENVELILDPDKRGYAETEKERLKRLRAYVHFQLSNSLTSGLAFEKAKERLVHRYELALRRTSERRAPKELPGAFAEAYALGLDPHTSYFSPEVLADFQISMRLSLEGIGAVLRSKDGFTLIQSLVPGGQADKQNVLRPKDKIVAVAQESGEPVQVMDMDLRDVVQLIRGKKGTKVTLTVLRDGPPAKTFTVTIVRDKVDVKEQAAKITYETRKRGKKTYTVGVIDLPSFYGSRSGRTSYRDVKRLVREARNKGVDGIVVDLSRNGGGLLDDAVLITGLFMQTGAVVATRDVDGDLEVLEDEDDSIDWNGPLLVLISPASASASEIVAGALKAYDRAIIAGGSQTFGKGTVQKLNPLPADLGAIKVTTGMFFLPSGKSTQRIGVTSHIPIPSVLDGYKTGEKDLDYALPGETMAAFRSKRANANNPRQRFEPINKRDIGRLATKSAARVKKDPILREVVKDLAEDEADDKAVIKLAELRAKAKEEGDIDEDEAKERFEARQEAFVDEGVNILVDSIHGRRRARRSARR